MNQITTIQVDISKPQMLVIHEKQNDSGRFLYVKMLDDGTAITSFPTGTYGMVRIRKPDGTACVYDSTETGQAIVIQGDTIRVRLVDQALTAAGRAVCSVGLYTSTTAERITSFNFYVDIEQDAVTDEEIESTDYYNVLTAQIAAVLEAYDDTQQMTVHASSIAATSQASAVISGGSGTPLHIEFGIPRAASGLTTSFLHWGPLSVAASAWAADSTYSAQGYGYKATLACTGMTADFMPFVAFPLAAIISGKVAPIWNSKANGCEIWATEPVAISGIEVIGVEAE